MRLFELENNDGDARAGRLHTPHGEVRTPAFMPVATQGSVKALDSDDVEAVGAEIVLGNTYHLYLRPGIELVREMGGLHSFMDWQRPILTDSGGFQGFSLEHLRKIDEGGITFKSHLDGSMHEFTPEGVVEHQKRLGVDIMMPLDVCLPAGADRDVTRAAVERTARWAERSLDAHGGDGPALFGIVQGGLMADLRQLSAERTVAMRFPGYSIGGLSVGETKAEMYEMAGLATGMLPVDAPRYLMGVGAPEDLVEGVARGVDMFDCALPTRIARNGALFTGEGRVHVYTARFKSMEGPIDPECDCYTCARFSAAYLHHLFKAKELLAMRLGTIHNLRFIFRLMRDMRASIVDGSFAEFRTAFHQRYVPANEERRQEQRLKRGSKAWGPEA
ncbi:MAG: tRNA guanosine(34) transglycosylase Tgt [SAR202 cluster bacterium]|nr:tRNA guanosine(34) transglycosylase Tgt [SAR202 cluster bacterium]